MSTVSICTLDTADSVSSIFNLKKLENTIIDLSSIFTNLDIIVKEVNETESIVESNSTTTST